MSVKSTAYYDFIEFLLTRIRNWVRKIILLRYIENVIHLRIMDAESF